MFYDEIEFEDLIFENGLFKYPCPCGDDFVISLKDLLEGEEVAKCPSCTLQIKIIYDPEDVEAFEISEESDSILVH